MVSTHFPPYHLGGDAVFVDYLSRELIKLGHEVHVLHNPTVYKLFRSPDETMFGDTGDDPVHRHSYKPGLGSVEPFITLTTGFCRSAKHAVVDIASNVRPDVIHWHNSRGFIGAPFIVGAEISLYTAHDYGSICQRSNLLKPDSTICTKARMCTVCSLRWKKPPQLWRTSSRRVLSFPKGITIIAPSDFVANKLNDEGVKVHHVLRNFVPDPGQPIAGSDEEHDSIIYLGMLETHKGLNTMVKAFIKSGDRHGLKLNIVGTGSMKHNLAEMSAESRFSSRIRIHGFLSRRAAETLRGNAAAQIVPSEWLENCPLTILEALAKGIPVIGSKIGGIPEILNSESGSAVFEPGNADELADNLENVWHKIGDFETLSRKARNAYETQFAPSIHMRRYMDIINHTS